MSGAIDSTSIIGSCFSGGSGSVFVSTTRWIGLFFSRSIAGPDSTPWVAIAHTSVAPREYSRSAADVIVPAVSIMSSVSTHKRPLTSPMTSVASATLAVPLGRRL